MDLAEKIPGMSDDALQTLASNARRLVTDGTAAQQNDARSLMPAIDAELATRRDAKLAKLRAASATRKVKKRA
jgi:hypothetical protein